jgi:hypothetical protein
VHSGPHIVVNNHRKARPGAENDLLEQFLAELPGKQFSQKSTIIFREPKLESRFPDLVVVTWSPRRAKLWEGSRPLTQSHFRLMQALLELKGARELELHSFFGAMTARLLNELLEWGLARRNRDRWKLLPIRRLFAISRIIAVEAKVGDWSRALDQAIGNTWFASHSYVLLGSTGRGKSLVDRASRLGVGVWTFDNGNFREHVGAHRYSLPRSYASWLFNDLVARHDRGELATSKVR